MAATKTSASSTPNMCSVKYGVEISRGCITASPSLPRLDHPALRALGRDGVQVVARPCHVDPCGENGEFHTFVFDGPNFKEPLRFSADERIFRDSF